jgi:HEAT repeat protein
MERIFALEQIKNFFSSFPDKLKAWNDLHILTKDESTNVRSSAAKALGFAFSHVPDKQQAWNDLHRLTGNESSSVRYSSAQALGSAFSHVPDKQQAWNDLLRLTNDGDMAVRSETVEVLGSVFFQVPDKRQAWSDLYRLSEDFNIEVRSKAAEALGSTFFHMPDKQKALKDLTKLTNAYDMFVRPKAYHSLGRVSIFMASQAETDEDYKKKLEKAIEFFETAAKEGSSIRSNPAQFCLPFYRSFHSIIFKKQEAKEEVNKYLGEAKAAIEGSESKKQLFEAVENLSKALKEVQNLENMDLPEMKSKLNFYRIYCERAAELMKDTDEKAPYATEVLRKALPILDRNLKGLIEEIQEKARTAYRESIKTATEEIAYSICREVQEWEIGSQEEMACNVENLIFTLESNFLKISENQYIFNKIQQIREQKNVARQLAIISTIIPLIPKAYMEQKIDEIKNDIREVSKKMDCLIIYLEPGIKEEVEISVGTEILGTGVTHKITIPLQEISYSELKEDLEKIAGTKINKLSKLPGKLANKVKGYLLLHDKEDVLEKLT